MRVSDINRKIIKKHALINGKKMKPDVMNTSVLLALGRLRQGDQQYQVCFRDTVKHCRVPWKLSEEVHLPRDFCLCLLRFELCEMKNLHKILTKSFI